MFDSNEELLFNEWLEFVKEKGYINSYFKNVEEVITIVPVQQLCLIIKNKNKCNTLLRPWTYKYDFKIEWNDIAKDLFFNNIDDSNYKQKCFFLAKNNVSYVDVKGIFTRNNRVTDITFPLVQKTLYYYHNMYIQKIIPIKLFTSLFATNRYLLEDNVYKITSKKGKNKNILLNFNQFINVKN